MKRLTNARSNGRVQRVVGVFAAAACAVGVSVSAQAPQTPAAHQTAIAPATPVVITGCVQTETEYRSARDKGRGGVAGTGLGQANEYVLVNASPSRNPADAVATSGSDTPSGTMSYELSGKGEGDVGRFVHQRVEITGTLKAQEIGSAGPTGGASAKVPILSQDLKLRELDVTSVRAITGSCN